MASAKDKHALALIFGVPKHPEEDGEPDGMEPPDDFKDACKEAMSALKEGDEEGFCMALWAAFHIADSAPHKEGEHEGEGEDGY